MKEEGWWLVAGDCHAGELYALKRVSVGLRTTARLTLPADAICGGGEALAAVDLLLVCDSYLGLDQQHRMKLGGGGGGRGGGGLEESATGQRQQRR